MVHRKEKKLLNLDEIDKWLENFFLDPLTTYLDETTFRIDLYETDDDFIVEVLLPGFQKNDIFVFLKNNQIIISVSKRGLNNDLKQRTIPFPFQVFEHEVTATFEDGILEIYISKYTVCNGKNRSLVIKNRK